MGYLKSITKRTSLLAISLLFASLIIVPSAAAASHSLGSWAEQTANPLPAGIEFSSAATYKGYVYLIGGKSTPGNNHHVYYAKLNDDGSVGTWKATSNEFRPNEIYGTTAVASNGHLYILGGYKGSGSSLSSVVNSAEINADGSVGSWAAPTTAAALPHSLYQATSVVHNDYIYVIGGDDDKPSGTSGELSSVYYAKVNPDGSVGSWTTAANSLPQPRSGATSVVHNGYLYVIGGAAGTSKYSSVFYAKLNTDGSVGNWTTAANSLPKDTRFAAVETINDYIYVMGGNYSTYVFYAKLNTDGSVGNWTNDTANPLPEMRTAAASFTHKGHVYIASGQDDNGQASDTVFRTQIAQEIIVPPAQPGSNPGSNPASGPGTPAAKNSPSDTTNPKAPDTGYGMPNRPDPIATALIVGASVSTAAGVALLYRQKRTKS